MLDFCFAMCYYTWAFRKTKYAPVAQLDRVFGYEPKGQGFESLLACQKTDKSKLVGFLFYVVLSGVLCYNIINTRGYVIMDKKRCTWCNMKNQKYIKYHDNEWCQPNFEDEYLCEMLILESFQAGLSWECVLNKRDAFRKAYDNFDIDKVCSYNDEKIAQLLSNKDIIRNKLKINASINNTKIFKEIVLEFGSFYNYLNVFTKGEILYETGKTTNNLSDAISKDLIKRGMKFVGSTIIYSYLQAIGIIYSHDEECYLYKEG